MSKNEIKKDAFIDDYVDADYRGKSVRFYPLSVKDQLEFEKVFFSKPQDMLGNPASMSVAAV